MKRQTYSAYYTDFDAAVVDGETFKTSGEVRTPISRTVSPINRFQVHLKKTLMLPLQHFLFASVLVTGVQITSQ